MSQPQPVSSVAALGEGAAAGGVEAPTAPPRVCRAGDGSWLARAGWRLLWIWLVAGILEAVTLEDLRRDPDLTPQKYARYFRNFKYVYHEEIQPPEVFLSTEAGDCDDYATLAASLLGARGYHPKLYAIRMPGLTHVVCYIMETSSYLDFNNRVYLSRLQHAKPDIHDIARRVAKSFDASWTSASEFTYEDGLKHMVATVTQIETYTGATPAAAGTPASSTSRIKIDF